MRTVITEDQRNHHMARDIKLGKTFPFVPGSSAFKNGTFTRLKKYSNPTQVIPASKCTKRNTIWTLAWWSEGNIIRVSRISRSMAGMGIGRPFAGSLRKPGTVSHREGRILQHGEISAFG